MGADSPAFFILILFLLCVYQPFRIFFCSYYRLQAGYFCGDFLDNTYLFSFFIDVYVIAVKIVLSQSLRAKNMPESRTIFAMLYWFGLTPGNK